VPQTVLLTQAVPRTRFTLSLRSKTWHFLINVMCLQTSLLRRDCPEKALCVSSETHFTWTSEACCKFTEYDIQGVSFIVFFNTVAFSHRNRTTTGTFHYSCRAEGHNKTYIILFRNTVFRTALRYLLF
jgi:hypothetical protein